ncbi:MAG TPA: hypothetical protein VLS44_08705 [Nitrospira sp.]|nr:hypothetical protein [Nitrospira sp.]
MMSDFLDKAVFNPLAVLGRDILAILPNVFAMFLIVMIGLISAWLLGYAVERVLRIIRLDHLADRLGVTAALARGGVKKNPSYLIGRAAYWMVFLFAALAALGALNLKPINQFAQSFLAYLPHLFLSTVILVAGYVVSNFIAQGVLIAAVNAGLPPARLVADVARWGVQLTAIAMALEQLGIAQHVVVAGFALTFGGVVLAGAIAFGLGARDLAKDYLEGKLSSRTKDRAPEDLRHL